MSLCGPSVVEWPIYHFLFLELHQSWLITHIHYTIDRMDTDTRNDIISSQRLPAGRAKVRYMKSCATCQLMKKDHRFRARVYSSNFFNPATGVESIKDICAQYRDPTFPWYPAWMKVPPSHVSVYNHIKRNHLDISPQQRKKMADAFIIDAQRSAQYSARKKETKLQAVEEYKEKIREQYGDRKEHVKKLDDLIILGDKMVKEGTLKLTAGTYIQALALRENVDKNAKDYTNKALSNIAAMLAPQYTGDDDEPATNNDEVIDADQA